MKKSNNKGFMMAELLAVIVVVLVVFTVLYTNFLPTKGEYEKRIEYNDLDSMYSLYYLRFYILKSIRNNNSKVALNNNGYEDLLVKDSEGNITCNTKYSSIIDNISCNDLVKRLNIKSAIITKYKPSDYNGDLKDYLHFLDIKDSSNSSNELYRITIKTNTGYASSKLFSKLCSEKSYGAWKEWNRTGCTDDDKNNGLCESRSVKILKNIGSDRYTTLDDCNNSKFTNQFCVYGIHTGQDFQINRKSYAKYTLCNSESNCSSVMLYHQREELHIDNSKNWSCKGD